MRMRSEANRACADRIVASFAYARKDVSGNRKPQAIAHRGYKAKFPENTMGAFKGAVDVGADALETDIHLSKDGVVVLSHVGRPRSLSSYDNTTDTC
jgi:glycerophosphoryl diester phosphodiesterase